MTDIQFAESVRLFLVNSGLAAVNARHIIERYADALVKANASAWDAQTVGELLIKLEAERLGLYAARRRASLGRPRLRRNNIC
jgi:hypothetical protein